MKNIYFNRREEIEGSQRIVGTTKWFEYASQPIEVYIKIPRPYHFENFRLYRYDNDEFLLVGNITWLIEQIKRFQWVLKGEVNAETCQSLIHKGHLVGELNEDTYKSLINKQ